MLHETPWAHPLLHTHICYVCVCVCVCVLPIIYIYMYIHMLYMYIYICICIGSRLQGLGYRVYKQVPGTSRLQVIGFRPFGFRVQGLGYRAQVIGFTLLGFRVQGLGYRAQVIGFRLLGFRVQVTAFRLQDLDYWVQIRIQICRLQDLGVKFGCKIYTLINRGWSAGEQLGPLLLMPLSPLLLASSSG